MLFRSWPESRTFSIASYDESIMRFVIKNVGEYTSKIFNELYSGSCCTIKYPFGDLFDIDSDCENHLLIAGGIGVTPFLSIVKYFELKGRVNNVNMFYSAKYFDDLIHIDYFMKVLGDRLQLFITREQHDNCRNHRISLNDISKIANKETNIYICGSRDFNNNYKDLLSRNGYAKIHMDEWE